MVLYLELRVSEWAVFNVPSKSYEHYHDFISGVVPGSDVEVLKC